MQFKKNKIVLAIAAIILILLFFEICFVACINSILIDCSQTELQENSKLIANEVSTTIKRNLNTLSGISKNISTCTNAPNKTIKFLDSETKRNGLIFLAYADKNGCALTNKKQTLWFKNHEYFNKALNGQPTISEELVDIPGKQRKIIIYAVPAVQSNKIVGVLISAFKNDRKFKIISNKAFGSTGSVYIVSKTGNVFYSYNSKNHIGNFINYISAQTDKRDILKIRNDFIKNCPGKNIYTVNANKNIMGYSNIPDTKGWMIVTSKENKIIISPINHILLISYTVFLIILLQFIFVSIYLVKLNIQRKQETKYFTYTDTLTKIPNRKGIKKNMTRWLKYCREKNLNGGIFLLDIDNFESVNNTFSHTVGDKFLVEAAERLSQFINNKDFIGRIGGDEFALFISNIHTVEELKEYAKTLLSVFNQPFIIYKNTIQLSCSIGIIFFDCKETKKNNECDEIINRGKFVMHKAKNTLKGSFAIFNDEYGEKINYQKQIEHELTMSIHNKELTCYYQPQYSNEKKEIVGFEVLARWKSNKFGMVPPVKFIPIAEKTGFIKNIGHFIVDQTFAFAKSIEGQGICVSFNVSPVELLQADFTDYIIKRYKHFDLSPNSIAMEVTESCLIESFDEITKKLLILKSYGIFISLDDFGTGFSSLTYLKKLPINLVKIDKSFIDEIVTDKVEKDIVDMIINLAYKLNLQVIAEGVENEEQIKIVTKCGCNIIQGYYISPPVPESDALSLLEVLHK